MRYMFILIFNKINIFLVGELYYKAFQKPAFANESFSMHIMHN